ncbi:hypothetical protein [Marinactinospora rubrisoli]|uniref:Tail assembly chaperone E/41/14-like protein n=1 Tax=Marinactinospora rubrisoli TaxID=2715399 RepID=A0ABW2KN50_9ACTN
MAKIDLSALQQPESAGTVVVMPEGDEITLRPLMTLGSEHDQTLLDAITAITNLKEDAGVGMGQLHEVMPIISKLLAAAAPTKRDAARIDRLPLMARFRIIMGYVGDQDLGGLLPSEG